MTAPTDKLLVPVPGDAHGYAGACSCLRSERLQPFTDTRESV